MYSAGPPWPKLQRRRVFMILDGTICNRTMVVPSKIFTGGPTVQIDTNSKQHFESVSLVWIFVVVDLFYRLDRHISPDGQFFWTSNHWPFLPFAFVLSETLEYGLFSRVFRSTTAPNRAVSSWTTNHGKKTVHCGLSSVKTTFILLSHVFRLPSIIYTHV